MLSCFVSLAAKIVEYFPLLLTLYCAVSPPQMWPNDYGETAIQQGVLTYDFVIVGAGTAGSVLASRLSANPQCKVLVIEAGGDPTSNTEVSIFLQLESNLLNDASRFQDCHLLKVWIQQTCGTSLPNPRINLD